jgi:DNA polymerase III epsilon subunit-like protein
MTLAKKYSIPVSDAHNALSDALVTAQLLQRLITNLQRFNISAVEDLLRIGRPHRTD